MPFRLPPMNIDERIANQRQNYALEQQKLMQVREERRLAQALRANSQSMPTSSASNSPYSIPTLTQAPPPRAPEKPISTIENNYKELYDNIPGTSEAEIENDLANRYSGYTTGASQLKGEDLYYKVLRDRESTNNYKEVNKLGYLGGYQMGAAALIDAGLVKKGTKNSGLNNPKNWIKGMNKEKFLNSPKVQDAAVRRYTDKQKRYLGDVYTKAKTDAERYALLGASHLIGAGGYKKNPASVDANGISGNDYYDLFYKQKY